MYPMSCAPCRTDLRASRSHDGPGRDWIIGIVGVEESDAPEARRRLLKDHTVDARAPKVESDREQNASILTDMRLGLAPSTQSQAMPTRAAYRAPMRAGYRKLYRPGVPDIAGKPMEYPPLDRIWSGYALGTGGLLKGCGQGALCFACRLWRCRYPRRHGRWRARLAAPRHWPAHRPAPYRPAYSGSQGDKSAIQKIPHRSSRV